jgi:hypothetical protein
MTAFRMPLCAVFPLFAALFLFPGGAASYAQQKFALVIGNGAYTGITRLNNPANDAADVSAALRGLGFTVDTLTNGSRVQMEEAVTRLQNRLAGEPGSYGFFFYAGHGVQSGGENYLIPVDADIPAETYLRDRALPMQAVLGELNDAGNTLNIVVLDSCRDNPYSWRRSGSRGLQVVSGQPADSIIVYATSAGATAADGTGRNGLFTTYLLANLKTPGLSVQEVFNKTGADVRRASNGSQIPAVYSQFFETAYLGNSPVVAVQPDPATQPAPAVAPQPSLVPAAVQPDPAHVQPAPVVVKPTAQPVRPTPALGVDVYIAGNADNAAYYWKNGVKTALSDSRTDAEAYAIAVSGNNVYIAGYEGRVAWYWKNGVKTALSGSTYAKANAIAVSWRNVYVAGYEDSAAGNTVACYWKNGVKTALSDGSTYAEANAIAVSWRNVYIAGCEYNAAGESVACYWKNGVKTALSDGSTYAEASAIAVSWNNVYIAGNEGRVACYWKNGVRTALSDGRTSAEASAIAVSGNDVYVAGYEQNAAGNYVACYWKNGVKTALSDGSDYAEAYAIAVSGNDVYVAGYEGNAACYWKNGVKTALSDGKTDAWANAIALVTR